MWQEDESPYKLIAGIVKDRGVKYHRIGIEERVRFFIADGVRLRLPSAQYVIATPVTAGCRMIKSPAEIALMQHANEITLQAIGATLKALKPGMSQHDVSSSVASVTQRLGGTSDGALVIFGNTRRFRTEASNRRRCATETSCSSTRDAPWTAMSRTSHDGVRQADSASA